MNNLSRFNELVFVSHSRAKRKGWYEIERTWTELMCLFHSEISEAFECLRDGDMETRISETGKPEGFWVEIADLVIRIADYMGSEFIVYMESIFTWPTPLGVDLIGLLHGVVSDNGLRGNPQSLSFAVDLCFDAAEIAGVDLWEVIDLKGAYNETRPHRHGGKLL